MNRPIDTVGKQHSMENQKIFHTSLYGRFGYFVMSIAFAAIYLANGQIAEEGKTVGNYFGLMLYFAQVISILIFGILSFFYISKLSKDQ